MIFTFIVFLSSCYSKIELFSNKVISKDVNFRDGAIVNVKISNFNNFATKSNSSVAEANSDDIKSLNVFLTTNSRDPFAIGSNPFGNGSIVAKDNFIQNSIMVSNVPVGGPYYAIFAVFDDVNSKINKKNITEPNLYFTSIDNKWAISVNSVTVLPSRNLVFSDSSNTLNVTLIMRKPIPSNITADITISDGTTDQINLPVNVN